MFILGISCFYHDSAAVLIKDGELVAAAEEERFSRKKLDYVAYYEKPVVKFERILTAALSSFPRSWKTFGESMVTWWGGKLWMKNIIMEKIEVPPEKIIFTAHHMSHAASALFASPFEEAAILTIDGVGEWATSTICHGTGKDIKIHSFPADQRCDLFQSRRRRSPNRFQCDGESQSAVSAFGFFGIDRRFQKNLG